STLTLTCVTWRGGEGVSLHVPPGQSVALHSDPPSDATALLDIIAGLRQPLSGQVKVDGFAVDQRPPLLPSLSATDNVLAVLPMGEVDTAARERAGTLLAITGVTHLDKPAGTVPAEQQWRILIARTLLLNPRLVLAEDPAP